MPRPIPTVEHAMEAQVGIRALRSATHPLWEAAIATGNWTLISEVKALAGTLKVAAAQARRIAALAEPSEHECADGIREPGHGKAA